MMLPKPHSPPKFSKECRRPVLTHTPWPLLVPGIAAVWITVRSLVAVAIAKITHGSPPDGHTELPGGIVTPHSAAC